MKPSPTSPRTRFLDQVAGRPVARGLRWQERYIPAVNQAVPPDVTWDSFRRYLDARDRLVGAL